METAQPLPVTDGGSNNSLKRKTSLPLNTISASLSNSLEETVEFPDTYEGRFLLLQEYYERHGHIKVSHLENRSLMQWIGNLRKDYNFRIQKYGAINKSSADIKPSSVTQVAYV
jgi:hypothetical protein